MVWTSGDTRKVSLPTFSYGESTLGYLGAVGNSHALLDVAVIVLVRSQHVTTLCDLAPTMRYFVLATPKLQVFEAEWYQYLPVRCR